MEHKLESILAEYNITEEDDVLGFGTIFQTLILPEKEFALLSGMMIEELEKSLSSLEDRLLLVQGLNAAGLKAEDLNAVFVDSVAELQEQLKDTLSQQKIDFLKRFTGLMVEAVNATEGIAKRIVPVAISYCHPDAKQPKYARIGDAGMDVYAVEDITIMPGETVLIPTGIKVALPLGYELQVRPRSGQSIKTKLRVANSPGTIDANYRDEIKIIIENIEPEIIGLDFEKFYDSESNLVDIDLLTQYGRNFVIEKGQRIAQLVLKEQPMCQFYEVDDVSQIGDNRESGFGGTGDF